jgi:hypothetical protein
VVTKRGRQWLPFTLLLLLLTLRTLPFPCLNARQFMVTNKLSEEAVVAQAESLHFPSSVIEYLQGACDSGKHHTPGDMGAVE